MARREVIEVTCDRCGRTETQDKSEEAAVTKAGAELKVMFHDESVEYVDLCMRCRKACEGYFKSMTKQKDEESEAATAPEPEKTGMFGLGGKK